MGNNLQKRIWSRGDESEDEIASENALLNEVDEPRFVSLIEIIQNDWRLCLRVIIARAIKSCR